MRYTPLPLLIVVAAFLTSGATTQTSQKTFVDDYIVGDSPSAVSDGIDRAIEVWIDRGGDLVFGRRIYRISRTIDLSPKRIVGGRILCIGGANSDYFNTAQDLRSDQVTLGLYNMGSAIVWAGDADSGPMVRYAGSDLYWDGPALWGSTREDKSKPASVCFEINKGSGIGSGKVVFNQLTVAGAGTGLFANGKTNVDMLHLRYFRVYDVNYGYYSTSAQNVANQFDRIHAHTVRQSLLHFDDLTHTAVTNVVLNNSIHAMLSFNKSSNSAGKFTCRDVRIDPATKHVRIVDNQRHTTYADLFFADISGGNAATIHIHGETSLTLDRCSGLVRPGSIASTGRNGGRIDVMVSRTRIKDGVTAESIFTNARNTQARFRDCTRFGDNRAIEDQTFVQGVDVG